MKKITSCCYVKYYIGAKNVKYKKITPVRYILTFILLLCAILPVAIAPAPVKSATAGITLNSSVQISYPTLITFRIQAQSSDNIIQLRLHYIVDRQNYASVVSEGWAVFNPAASVETQWVWDMRKSILPPGANVEYWWSALDAAGRTAMTEHYSLVFNDDRYKWQSISEGPITLSWYSGNDSFANSLMEAAQQGLTRIENNTGAVPEGKVHIYIYASAQDLQGAHLFAPQWEGGVNFTGYNVIAIGVHTSQLEWGRRAVAHELTHWIVNQITFNSYGAGLPVWLEEGLATYGEGELSFDYQYALDSAIKNNKLISVRSLSSPFSALSEEAYISYGESNSIVTFLIENYGKDNMKKLLDVFQKGSGYDEALQQVYGFDQDGLDLLWRQSLDIEESFSEQSPDISITLITGPVLSLVS